MFFDSIDVLINCIFPLFITDPVKEAQAQARNYQMSHSSGTPPPVTAGVGDFKSETIT